MILQVLESAKRGESSGASHFAECLNVYCANVRVPSFDLELVHESVSREAKVCGESEAPHGALQNTRRHEAPAVFGGQRRRLGVTV